MALIKKNKIFYNVNNVNYDKMLKDFINVIEINKIIDYTIGVDYKTIQKFNNVIKEINTIERIEINETQHGIDNEGNPVFVNHYFPSYEYSLIHNYDNYSFGSNIVWKYNTSKKKIIFNDLTINKKYKYFKYHKDDNVRFDTIMEDNKLIYNSQGHDIDLTSIYDITYDVDNKKNKIYMIVQNNIVGRHIFPHSNVVFSYKGIIIDNYQIVGSILRLPDELEIDKIIKIFDNIIEKKLYKFTFKNFFNVITDDDQQNDDFYIINFINKDNEVINFDNISCLMNLDIYFYNSDLENISEELSSDNPMEEICITISSNEENDLNNLSDSVYDVFEFVLSED